jgi:hypothetical protein
MTCCPMACVMPRRTLPGYGWGEPTHETETAIVQNHFKKRAESQPSGAGFVGRVLSFEAESDEQIIITCGSPNGVGCDKNTTHT